MSYACYVICICHGKYKKKNKTKTKKIVYLPCWVHRTTSAHACIRMHMPWEMQNVICAFACALCICHGQCTLNNAFPMVYAHTKAAYAMGNAILTPFKTSDHTPRADQHPSHLCLFGLVWFLLPWLGVFFGWTQ